MKNATASFCFQNVERRVEERGGSSAFGWAIWHLPGLYFEAEHHAVWRNKLGNLIDVSPQLGDRRRLLFLPDESAVYDPFTYRTNIMVADGTTQRATRIAELGRQRHALLARCRVPGTAEVRLYDADQLELAEIDRGIHEVLNG